MAAIVPMEDNMGDYWVNLKLAEVISKLNTATTGTAQANSTATDVAGLVVDFNALLAKLRTAGIIS